MAEPISSVARAPPTLPTMQVALRRPVPPGPPIRENPNVGAGSAQCLMCKQAAAAAASAELCRHCAREYEGLSEKPCLAVLRFDMAQRTALQASQRTEAQRLAELKALFARKMRFAPRGTEDEELVPVSSSTLRATARREVNGTGPSGGAAKVKISRPVQGTIRAKVQGLASSEAKHAAARAAMDRRRRIKRGEAVTSSEEESSEEDEDDPVFSREARRDNGRPDGRVTPGGTSRRPPRHALAQQKERSRCRQAFCMGTHRRLGKTSPIRSLPTYLVRRIVSMMDDVLLDLGMLTEHTMLSPIGPSKAARGAVTALAADPSTGRLFAGAADGSIVVWCLETGAQLQVLRNHAAPIAALQIVMDQKHDRDRSSSAPSTPPSSGSDGSSTPEAAAETEANINQRMSLLQLRFPDQSMRSLGRLLRYHRGDVDEATLYIEAHEEGHGVAETHCVVAVSASPAGASTSKEVVVQPKALYSEFSTQSSVGEERRNRTHLACAPYSSSGKQVSKQAGQTGFLVSACAQGVCVWDLGAGLRVHSRLHHVSGASGAVDSINVLGGSSSLPLLVCGGKSGQVHLWDLDSRGASGEGNTGLRQSMRGHSAPVTALVLKDQALGAPLLVGTSGVDETAGSLWCVSGSEDGTIRRWDLLRGLTTHILEGHDSAVTSLALAPVLRPLKADAGQGGAAAAAAAAGGGLGFWRLFSGGDGNDGCVRCWDSFECFTSATEPKNTAYRYDRKPGQIGMTKAQATAVGSSRKLGHEIGVEGGVRSLIWVEPGIVGETSSEAVVAGGGKDRDADDYAGWLCCTLADQTVVALRASDCASRGTIALSSTAGGGNPKNLGTPASSLVGIFRSAVVGARSQEREKVDPVATVVAPVTVPGGGGKKAVLAVCAVGDAMRMFATSQ